MYNLQFKCLMKCLNEYFIDCFLYLIVKIWNNGRVDQRSCTIQQRRSSELEGSVSWCNVKRPEGWTEWIQPRSQPRRHKEGGKRSVETSNARRRKSIIHLGGVKERRKHDEHVLGVQHVPVDWYAGNVAQINWRYYQESDSARRWSLDRECTFRLQQLSSSRWGNSN